MNPAILFAAPHRLPFLAGVAQLTVMMLWWLAVLAGIYSGTAAPPGGTIPQVLLHAPILIYMALSPLFFGFLLTVFPRWTGYADLDRRIYAPVSAGYAIATLLSWSALLTGNDMLLAGSALTAFTACLWGTAILASIMLRETRDGKKPTWHGWSIIAASGFGLAGQAAFAAFLFDPASPWLTIANRLGLWAFILPVFVTVCHRMIPFFAGNVVDGYVRWRPFQLLGTYWVATLMMLAGQLTDAGLLKGMAALILCVITAYASWKWWPRSKAPGLLWVLVIGFAWAPVGYALALLAAIGLPLGRAPEHALTIGFAASLLVAMVTRVTQGHSGRALELPATGKIAFAGMQAAALVRIIAAAGGGTRTWLIMSAVIFVLALLPWAIRNAAIYSAPRKDGKPG